MQTSLQPAGTQNTHTACRPDLHAAVMRRFIGEVVSNGNFAVLDELVHPDYVYRAPGQELAGSKELEALFVAYRTAFSDLEVEIDELITVADKVVVAFTLTGTHDGPFMGSEASGRQVKVNGVVISRFEDGRILEEWEVLDQLTMLQQLGVVEPRA